MEFPNFEDAFNALQILGVENQFLEQNFAIYPNPVTNEFTISFPVSSEKVHLRVFNVLGGMVMEQTVFASENQVDIASLTSGMYIVTLEANDIIQFF